MWLIKNILITYSFQGHTSQSWRRQLEKWPFWQLILMIQFSCHSRPKCQFLPSILWWSLRSINPEAAVNYADWPLPHHGNVDTIGSRYCTEGDKSRQDWRCVFDHPFQTQSRDQSSGRCTCITGGQLSVMDTMRQTDRQLERDQEHRWSSRLHVSTHSRGIAVLPLRLV